MNTLKDIKRRVRFLLDQYSENGEPIAIEDTFYADSDLKFKEAVDSVQRKISVTSKKIVERIPLVLKSPKISATVDNIENESTEFYIPDKRKAYIKIPLNSKTFSFILNTEIGANTKIEIYAIQKSAEIILNLFQYEFGELFSDESNRLNLSDAVKYKDKSFDVVSEQAMSLTAGYLPSDIDIEKFELFIIRIIADNNYPAVIFKFAAYENFFGSKDMIPEKGYTTAKLPADIIEILSIEKSSQNIQSADTKGFDFLKSINGSILTAPIEKSGIYSISYYRYPKRITFETSEDTEVELDDYAVDALVFGVASAICPIENVAVIARMNSLFEETMRNIYNTDRTIKRIGNKVYQPRKLKLND